MLSELIRQAWEAVPLDAVLGSLEQVSRYDRYQASHGIVQAAGVVAQAAREAGLADVEVHAFPADGKATFWSFQSPVSWTPTTARLEVLVEAHVAMLLDHAVQPFLLATYSAATPAGGVHARLAFPSEADVQGAVVLLDAEHYSQGDLLRALPGRGAIGFITDAPCCIEPGGAQFSGRVELASDSPLFGFSITADQWLEVAALAANGARVRATIDVDRSAPMPAVSAVLPGSSVSTRPEGEVWITSHLCHPRPGANDNASGVAALLGVAATLQALAGQGGSWARRRRSIRFIWAPEFVGTAALLEAHGRCRDRAPPHAVLNLDMVGEDQSLCGSPFVVERSPESFSTPAVPLAEAIVDEVFRQTARFPGRWRTTPFLGYSDHALFAGPRLACPAVQFTHWPDRFNHSAADTLDKVSAVEMRRSVTAAAVFAHCMADDLEPVGPELADVVGRWCATELAAARRTAEAMGPGAPPGWIDRLRDHVEANNARMLAAAKSGFTPAAAAEGHPQALLARWSGPFNLRAMVGALPPERRAAIADRIRADKSTLALIANFALRADGRRTAQAITDETSFALRRPIDPALARELIEVLLLSGWVSDAAGAADAAGPKT